MCTAAERQYALEVWRLLDHTGVLIPQALRKTRIVNVVGATKKTVLHTLGVLKPPKDVRRKGAAAALDNDDAGDANGGLEHVGVAGCWAAEGSTYAEWRSIMRPTCN